MLAQNKRHNGHPQDAYAGRQARTDYRQSHADKVGIPKDYLWQKRWLTERQ